MRCVIPVFLSLTIGCEPAFAQERNESIQEEVLRYPVKENGKWGFIDSTGRVAIDSRYDGADWFQSGLAAVNFGGGGGELFRGGKWGYIDISGKEIIPFQFDDARSFIDGYAAVGVASADSSSRDGLPIIKWGFINKAGKTVVRPRFDDVRYSSESLAWMRSGEFWGLIDMSDKMRTGLDFRDVLPFSEGRAWVKDKRYGWGIIDTSGTLIRPCNLSLRSITGFHEGLTVVGTKDKHWLIIDRNGTTVHDFSYDWVCPFENGLARVTQNGKCVFIDRAGNVKFSTDYGWTGKTSEGLALVSKNDKYGYADSFTYELVIPEVFADAELFHHGFAVVTLEEDGMKGFIDHSGKVCIQPRFYTASQFFGALARVGLKRSFGMFDQHWGYINTRGVVVWQSND